MSVQKTINADLSMFLISITALIIIGLIFIYSSSSIFALEKFGSASYFVKKQCIGLILGIIALMIARFIPLDLIKHLSPWLFLGSLALTSCTLLSRFSQNIHGSSRWLNIGGFGFQPSELIKVSFVLYLAYFLSKRIIDSAVVVLPHADSPARPRISPLLMENDTLSTALMYPDSVL